MRFVKKIINFLKKRKYYFKKIKSDLRFIFNCIMNPGKKKGCYIGWLGYGNLGDEALKEAIYSLFCNKFVMLINEEGPILRYLQKKGCLQLNFVILGGGTLINSNEYFFNLAANRKENIKIVFGTGVVNPVFLKNTPFYENDKAFLLRWCEVLNTFDFIGVRGPISADLLRSGGVHKETLIIGDPALFFSRPLKVRKTIGKRLGLNFAIPKDRRFWGGDEELWLNNFMQFVDLMLADGWEIELFPVWPDDIYDARFIQNKFGGERIKIFQNYHSVEKSLAKLEEFDVFLGVKLHSVILAYCVNTPSIMVEYLPKCQDFMASINMEDLNIKINEFDPIQVKSLVYRIYNDIENYRIRGNEACMKYKHELIKQAQVVYNIIEGSIKKGTIPNLWDGNAA